VACGRDQRGGGTFRLGNHEGNHGSVDVPSRKEIEDQMSLLINFGLYQIGWFAIVFGSANNRPWLAMGLGLAAIGVHLLLAHGWLRHLSLVLASGAIGLTLDSLQLWLGVFRFPSGVIVPWLAPPWEVVLWMQFATILPFCLRWLSGRYFLGSVLGLLGGPLAFYAGERLGAVSFLSPQLPHYFVLGIVWALAFPLLIWLSDTLVTARGLGGQYRLSSGRKLVTTGNANA
jgi:hypothetical protein